MSTPRAFRKSSGVGTSGRRSLPGTSLASQTFAESSESKASWWRTHSCVPCRHSCRHPVFSQPRGVDTSVDAARKSACATSEALFPTVCVEVSGKCRHGTQECVRHSTRSWTNEVPGCLSVHRCCFGPKLCRSARPPSITGRTLKPAPAISGSATPTTRICVPKDCGRCATTAAPTTRSVRLPTPIRTTRTTRFAGAACTSSTLSLKMRRPCFKKP